MGILNSKVEFRDIHNGHRVPSLAPPDPGDGTSTGHWSAPTVVLQREPQVPRQRRQVR